MAARVNEARRTVTRKRKDLVFQVAGQALTKWQAFLALHCLMGQVPTSFQDKRKDKSHMGVRRRGVGWGEAQQSYGIRII